MNNQSREMLSWTRHILLTGIILISGFRAAAQLPMPDKVWVGASKSYLVDSTLNPGSIYIWAIDDIVVQRGVKCLFNHTWTLEGTFMLTVRQISAEGCPGDLQTGQVIVNPAVCEVKIFPNPIFGPDIRFQISQPAGSVVTVDLFTMDGRRVCRIFDGYIPGGIPKTIIYPNLLAEGVYPYQIRTGKQTLNGKIVVLREY